MFHFEFQQQQQKLFYEKIILLFLTSFIEHFAALMDGVIFLTFSFGTIWLSTSLAQYTVLIRHLTVVKLISQTSERCFFPK